GGRKGHVCGLVNSRCRTFWQGLASAAAAPDKPVPVRLLLTGGCHNKTFLPPDASQRALLSAAPWREPVPSFEAPAKGCWRAPPVFSPLRENHSFPFP